MTPWADAAELRGDMVGFLDHYFRSADGDEAASLAGEFNGNPVLEVTLTDPDLVLQIDIAAGSVLDGPADDPAVRLAIGATELHELLLERLGPVEISRLVEQKQLHLIGPPRALAASVLLAAQLQPHYATSLSERGRDVLDGAPEPTAAAVWESEEPPPGLFGVRRPWQRPKGSSQPAW